ncbi:MAG: hypothetical protein WAW23_01880, partial [Candidatus Methanoperedens sp.]
MSWIASMIWRKRKPEEEQVSEKYLEKYLDKLNIEITEISNEYQELIKEYDDAIQKLKIDITDINNRYQEAKNKIEKDRETIVNKEKEIESERRTSSDIRKELEMRTGSIKGHEESIQKLKNELAEMNNRYQEAIDKLNAEMDNAISLEMLILELDRELGLMDFVKKTNENKEIQVQV